jgi:hypothetical protein
MFFHLKVLSKNVEKLGKTRGYVSHTLLFYFTIFFDMRQQYVANALSINGEVEVSGCIHERRKTNKKNFIT